MFLMWEIGCDERITFILYHIFCRYDDAAFKLTAALKVESQNIKFIVSAKEKLCHCYVKVSAR